MEWQDILIPIVRGLILDLDDTAYKYTDLILERVVLVATQIVSQSMELGYTTDFTTAEITPDITTDEEAQNLISLKAACMLQVADAAKAAEKGYLIKDAIGMIDTRNFPGQIIDILRSGKSYCDMYEQAVTDNMQNNIYKSAQAIVGPIRQWAMADLGSKRGIWR